jgi:hypothetical protein
MSTGLPSVIRNWHFLFSRRPSATWRVFTINQSGFLPPLPNQHGMEVQGENSRLFMRFILLFLLGFPWSHSIAIMPDPPLPTPTPFWPTPHPAHEPCPPSNEPSPPTKEPWIPALYEPSSPQIWAILTSTNQTRSTNKVELTPPYEPPQLHEWASPKPKPFHEQVSHAPFPP